jgi:hypothetical protein
VKLVVNETPSEAFVVQEAIEPQLLCNGYRFSVRIYLAAVSSPPSTTTAATSTTTTTCLNDVHNTLLPSIQFYTYSHGWVTRPVKPYSDSSHTIGLPPRINATTTTTTSEAVQDEAILKDATTGKCKHSLCSEEEQYEFARNLSRDRHHPLSDWSRRDEFMPKFRRILQQVLIKLKPKLVVKEDVKSFELFGVDFIVDASPEEKVWLVEVNRSPRQMDADIPMLHALMDIVHEEDQTPLEKKDGNHKWHVLPLTLGDLQTSFQSYSQVSQHHQELFQQQQQQQQQPAVGIEKKFMI